jgi:ATP-dependent RNA helicase DHX37/DHR1
VEKTRFDLPVTAMEFEITDAIRNNDVTIICGETGSGKSTQVPQYLYENGMTFCPGDSDKSFTIGITQPRRVAAVSTAKRVCYEMGQGNGQTIRGTGKQGNLVAFQTRYESAGVGEKTCIKFMTDGILLNEIQNDLLLRHYSVIVLDESHERNLNTDVLIGLLSAALPLRKKAAEQDPTMVPLKLVLMSATLRVEDFTKNDRLFPTGPPAVVRVPGRTHPVTIHHSKTTELDDYESAAYKKICKIHRKLPHGGILVFLTGKDEILRMVHRLRSGLSVKSQNKRVASENFCDVEMANIPAENDNLPREMDDEEYDADDLRIDDFDEIMNENWDEEIVPESGDDNIPKHATILPLYSLLSSDEQAKVFAPVPETHRLIVIATNIAETSITIPGISYVVDTGRQKCRNYNSGAGIASYDVMWISKAAAGQRAGRAGRTGPGHCYRLYSSSLYSRHMDDFALPEVLTRPLEDIILAMKSLKILNVSAFPFPTRKS